MRSQLISWTLYTLSVTFFWTLLQKKLLGSRISQGALADDDSEEHSNDDSSPDKVISDYWAGGIPSECEDLINIIRFPDICLQYGSHRPRGLLLYGEPGTGKTYFGKMLADILNANFFYTSASQLDEIYIGVGPKKIRALFEGAKHMAENNGRKAPKKTFGFFLPGAEDHEIADVDNMLITSNHTKIGNKKLSIIFIDEIDALGIRDSKHANCHNATISQLLTCMDGLKSYDSILVIAATNNLDAVDGALKRSGRFDRFIKMSLPNMANRYALLRFYLKKVPNIDLEIFDDMLKLIAFASLGFNCSDVELIINEGTLITTRRALSYIKNELNRNSESKDVVKHSLEISDLVQGFFHVHEKVSLEFSKQGIRSGRIHPESYVSVIMKMQKPDEISEDDKT